MTIALRSGLRLAVGFDDRSRILRGTMFHRLGKVDAEFYLKTRSRQSFNVVQ